MNSKVRRDYERAARCDKFSDSRAEDFPVGSRCSLLTAGVKERLAALSTLDVEKASSKSKHQQGTAGRQGAREELGALVGAMSRTASVFAIDHPDTRGMFELPSKYQSDRTLIATARSFGERAAPLVGLFVEYGLTNTIINDLRSKADAMESYMSMQNEGVGARINANASAREHALALNKMLGQLNLLYLNKYGKRNPIYIQWKSAYHLEAAPGSKNRSKGKDTGNDAPPNGDTPPNNDTPPPLPPEQN